MLKSDSRSVANTNASMAVNRSSVAGTSLASTNSTRMISSCYAMPLLDNAIIDNQISVIGRTITCDNYQEFNQKLEFHYDYTYANQHEFAKSAYTFNLAPLVRDALRGESNMILFGGVQSLNIHRFLLSQTVMQGLISQAAGQLLNAVNHSEEKMGSVTFSWYKLDCGTPEVITDVLKAASTITAGGNSLGGGGGSVKSSSDNSSVGNTSGLILREAGKSRGMYVPGLWEIEIANGAEIETVISHVLNAVPQIADHSLGTSHTIMQLSVTNKLISGQAPPPPPGSPGSATYRSTDDYSPVTGRITFLLLSNLSPADQQFLAPSSKAPQIPATVSANPNQWFPWVDQLFSILQWLESRRASPPFHKSRLLLILREVLLRRQRASLMLFIHPSIDQHQINIQWMKLFAFLSKDLAPTVVSFTNNIVSSTTSTTSTRRTPSAPRTRPDATDAVNLHSIKKAAEAKRSMTPTNQRNNPSRRSAAPLQTSRSLDLSEHQQRRVPGSATAARRNRSQDDFDLISRHVQNEGEEVYGEEKYEQSRGQMYGTEEDDEDYGEEPSSSVPFTTRARSGSNGSAGNRMGNTFPDQSPLPSRNIPEPTITPIAVSSRGPYPLLHQSSTQSTTSNFSASQKMGAGYVEDFNNHETEAALVVALEASRNEASALKIAYNYANDKYNEIKSAYDKLIVQLKEEGSMLEKRDKDRFKNALKDLKDYEIYKEVMETAMMRLQSELENLAKENTELRATKAYEEKQIQKQKNFSERYSKDLVSTKKRLTELETKYAQLEKQNKQLSREKDAAVAALAQTQGSQIQKVSQWQETASIKQREVEDLNKKVKALEERCKTLELEKESVLSSNLHEVANLRSAHSKALETLMGYQEENDVLRSAVVELSSKANSSAQNSRNNSIPPSSSPAINLASASTHSIQANDNATSPNNSPVHTPMPPNVANGGTSKDSNLIKPSLDISNATSNNTNSPNLSSPTAAVLNLAQRRQPIKSTTNYI